MSKSIWQLSGTQARLQTSAFSALLDLRRPQRGLHEVTCRGAMFSGASLFQIGLEPPSAVPEETLGESYVRERDLVAVYEATQERPVRVQVYWRALLGVEELTLPGLELVVSVQTRLLDSDPVLTIESRLPSGEALHLCNEQSGVFDPLFKHGESTARFEHPQPSCLLFRPPHVDFSYVELVHPTDFQRAELAQDAANSPVVIRQRLFADRLEKGVILRARLRGHVVPRVGDVTAAARLYAAFAAAEPMLTS